RGRGRFSESVPDRSRDKKEDPAAGRGGESKGETKTDRITGSIAKILKSVHLWTRGGFFEYGNQAGNKMSGLWSTSAKSSYWRTRVLKHFSDFYCSHYSIIPSLHYSKDAAHG